MTTCISKSATHRFYVLPSKSLADLVVRNAERIVPGCNYIVGWRDVRGHGIELAIAEWAKPGQTYVNRRY